MQAIF